MTHAPDETHIQSSHNQLKARLLMVFVLLVALVLFSSPLRQIRFMALADMPDTRPTLLEALEQVTIGSTNTVSPYWALRATWQAMIGSAAQAERMLSMLLWALTLACVYRLTRDQYSSRIAIASTLTVYPIGLALTSLDWITYYSWLSLLAVGSACLLIRLKRPDPGSVLTWSLYLISVVVLLISYAGLWIVLSVHAIYGLVGFLEGRKHPKRWLLGAGLAGLLASIAYLSRQQGWFSSLSAFLSQTFSLPSPWQSFVNWIDYNPPAISVLLAVVACIGFIIALLHQRPVQFSFATSRRYLIPTLWIILGLVAASLSKQWSFAALTSLAIPITIGLIQTFSRLSWRSRLVGALLGLMLLFFPEPLADYVKPVQNDIRSLYVPGTPVIVSLYHAGFQTADIAQLHYLAMSPVYYVIDSEWALGFNTHGLPSLEPIGQNWPPAAKELWLIKPTNSTNDAGGDPLVIGSGKELLQQQSETGVDLFIYAARPTHDPLYHFGPVTMLEFELQGETLVAPASTLILNSWWTLDEPVKDNYVLRLSLLNAGGQPAASDEGLLAASFTGTWTKNSLHFDRRVVQLPPALAPGNYNLVVSVHGTQFDTTNLPITLNDKSSIGYYGYLTTVTVTGN